MEPTTSGRFRIQERRVGGDDDESAEDDQSPSFTVVELPSEPVAPDDPDAAEAYAPLHIDGPHAVPTAPLEPGYVVDATVGWTDGTARFIEFEIVSRTRLYVADEVTGMFEAAREAWNGARAAGESVVSTTTRGQDGDPNGALYLFPDASDRDTLAELRSGRIPIEPLIARVNDRLDDDRDRAVFLLRPTADPYVAVLVAFDDDGILARTVRDTYDMGSALADRLEHAADETGVYAADEGRVRTSESDAGDGHTGGDGGDEDGDDRTGGDVESPL
ncbi:DUF6663 family protein [Halopenitus sp. POP-27]|uniref:DUF6663 family protein n=1 Tax=Halopenitus sp. POP-27 TaxID=2994425 RepID=UPI002468E319|nr:DUF6663 family protein [Halopenitus sp. POP-27]